MAQSPTHADSTAAAAAAGGAASSQPQSPENELANATGSSTKDKMTKSSPKKPPPMDHENFRPRPPPGRFGKRPVGKQQPGGEATSPDGAMLAVPADEESLTSVHPCPAPPPPLPLPQLEEMFDSDTEGAEAATDRSRSSASRQHNPYSYAAVERSPLHRSLSSGPLKPPAESPMDDKESDEDAGYHAHNVVVCVREPGDAAESLHTPHSTSFEPGMLPSSFDSPFHGMPVPFFDARGLESPSMPNLGAGRDSRHAAMRYHESPYSTPTHGPHNMSSSHTSAPDMRNLLGGNQSPSAFPLLNSLPPVSQKIVDAELRGLTDPFVLPALEDYLDQQHSPNDQDTFSVYDHSLRYHYSIPKKNIVPTQGSHRYIQYHHKFGDRTRYRFQLCTRFANNSCKSGEECPYIHCRLLPVSRKVHINENHWANQECLENPLNTFDYQTLPPGLRLPIFAPNRTVLEQPQQIESQNLLITHGSLGLYSAVLSSIRMGQGQSAPPPFRAKHCAHFQFRRMCHLGTDCNFIHSLVPFLIGGTEGGPQMEAEAEPPAEVHHQHLQQRNEIEERSPPRQHNNNYNHNSQLQQHQPQRGPVHHQQQQPPPQFPVLPQWQQQAAAGYHYSPQVYQAQPPPQGVQQGQAYGFAPTAPLTLVNQPQLVPQQGIRIAFPVQPFFPVQQLTLLNPP